MQFMDAGSQGAFYLLPVRRRERGRGYVCFFHSVEMMNIVLKIVCWGISLLHLFQDIFPFERKKMH